MKCLNYLILIVIYVVLIDAQSYDASDEEEANTEEIPTERTNVLETINVPKSQHTFGKPITVLGFTDDFNITVDYDNLRKLLLHPEVQNRKAVTVSIIGAFRKGKSFIMDYFLRFLYAKYKSINNMNEKNRNANWMGKPSDPLTGFSWKSGSERHTSGIVFWSDVFLYDALNGEKYAIYLIDTQGLFDTRTPLQENIKIFGLGTLISSLQIFNLNDVIQEDQLQYLQMATDYARFAVTENKAKGIKGIKAFQNLLFLMRDWKNVEEFNYGLEDGHRYLMDVLQIEDDQPQALQEVRMYIQSSFEKVYCFLMPHPGLKVINNKKYDGRFSEMSVDFRNELSNLVKWLFGPTNLKAKKVFNEELTSKKLFQYMQSYFEVFQMDAPEVESIYIATVSSHLKGLVDSYLTEFQNEISHQVALNSSDSIANLDSAYTTIKETILGKFKEAKKMGNEQQEEKFFKILSSKIDEFYKDFKKHAVNNHKAYVETVARAEQEKALFEQELDKVLHSNRTQLAKEIQELQEDYKNIEAQFATLKDNLEASRNELLQNVINDHSLSLEQIEQSKRTVEEAYQLKVREFELEERKRAELFERNLIEKQNEMYFREQALIEQGKKVEESLQKQEEMNNRNWEKEQAMKMEQIKFESMMEERRFAQENIRHAKEMEADQAAQMFEKEMMVLKMNSEEKLKEYELRAETIRQQSSMQTKAIAAENAKQQQMLQMEMYRIEQQSKLASNAQSQQNFQHLLQSVVQFAPLIASAGRSNNNPGMLQNQYGYSNPLMHSSYQNQHINSGMGSLGFNDMNSQITNGMGSMSYNNMNHQLTNGMDSMNYNNMNPQPEMNSQTYNNMNPQHTKIMSNGGQGSIY
ncbi:unnamed protein product [Chironomus riparius]|uniref:GB1/RHD3-type G domain-containing protein n=1 Tax=Chironomus riparius TaxID=315576 RepID=A0A9N9WYQ3_9DIPT|nr:unnamed protein product [Chironomus riparius]